MPSLLTLLVAKSLGRDAPFLIALSWNYSVLIMLRDSGLTTQAAK